MNKNNNMNTDLLKYDLSYEDFEIICKEILKKEFGKDDVTYEDLHFYINDFLKLNKKIEHRWTSCLDQTNFEDALEIFSYHINDALFENKKMNDYLNTYKV